VVVDEVPEEAEPPGQMVALEQQELAKRVDEALKTLPERQRLALTLFHHEGLSQIEVGDIMGISDEAVESLLARARRSLKTQLESEWQCMLADDNGT
jgi:RNA polymerase sigma-70 factor (ECF subfamily)